MTTQTGISISQVATVAVPVADQDRALAFFTGQLGFEIRRDLPFGNGQRWIEVGPPGGGTTVALAPHQPGQPIGIDTGIRFTTRSAEGDQAALRGRGVDADAELLRFGGPVPPMFTFRDPDGNQYVIVEMMAG